MLAGLLLAAVFGMNVYRAAKQPITHDEALTYHGFVAVPFHRLVTHFDTNNHLVNTLGCRLTTSLLGVSEIAMRLPSLAGGLAYLTAVFLLCRAAFGRGLLFLAAVALLSLNPFVLDYLSIARGYGLALGFLFWGIYHLDQFLGDEAWRPGHPDRRRRLVGGAVCLALAVYSNLTFVIIAASLAATFLAITCERGWTELDARGRLELLRSLHRQFLRPGLVVFGILAVTLYKARPSAFYVGEDSLAASLRGMVAASAAHHHFAWPCNSDSSSYQRLIDALATWGVGSTIFVAVIVGATTAWRVLQRKPDTRTPTGAQRLLLLAGVSLVLSCVLLLAAHLVLGMKYPHERTGIYLVPIFFLVAVAVVRITWRGQWPGRLAAVPGFALLAALVLLFASQLSPGAYREWRYDCTSRQVFDLVAASSRCRPGETVRVGCFWIYAPSLEFYRAARRADWLNIVNLRDGKGPCDAYVYPQELLPASERLRPLAFFPESGTVVGCTR
jgi:hypothetical protein